jgi:hypothetical protein
MHERFTNIIVSRSDSVRPAQGTLDVHRSFLNAQHDLQDEVLFRETIDAGHVKIGLSGTRTPYFNTALFKEPQAALLDLDQIQGVFTTRDREPALYVDETDRNLETTLTRMGWEKQWSDVWMRWNGGPIDRSTYEGYVDLVRTYDDLTTFWQTLRSAHLDKDSYNNPYGPIPNSQIDELERVWSAHHKSGRVRYFIGYDDERGVKTRKPVSVAAVTSKSFFTEDAGKLGSATLHVLTSGGTIPSARGGGFARKVVHACINEPATIHGLLQQGDQIHTLATVPEMGPHHFARRLGFEDVLTAGGWVKRQEQKAA